MFLQMGTCDCTVNYSENGISGTPTTTKYLGNGKWKCPECKQTHDHSEHTYKINIEIFMKDEYRQIRIVVPISEKLQKPLAPKSPLIVEAIEEDLNDEINKIFDNYKLGKYEIEVYWHWYKCSYEYDEYELDFYLISDKEIE